MKVVTNGELNSDSVDVDMKTQSDCSGERIACMPCLAKDKLNNGTTIKDN